MLGETRAGEDDPGDEGPNTASTWSHWVTTPKESVVTSTTVIPESWSPRWLEPVERGVDDSLPDREGNDEEHDEPHDGEGELVKLEATGLRKAGDEAEGDPADDIVGHTGRKGGWPKLRRMRPISPRILAITGSDEIDRAAATKRAKM